MATKSGTLIVRGGGDERAGTAGRVVDAEDAFPTAGTEAAEAPWPSNVFGVVFPFLSAFLLFEDSFFFFALVDCPAF